MNGQGITHVTPITREDIGTLFRTNMKKTHIHLNPHLIRTWTNSVLISKSIDPALRFIYLGHQRNNELAYLASMVPEWRQTLQEKKVLEALEEISKQPGQPEAPKPQLPPLSSQEYEFLRDLLRRLRASGIEP
jgi:hypothetical protein